MYQGDNALIHIARMVMEWFDEHETETYLIAQSPDLSNIEPLLGLLEESE